MVGRSACLVEEIENITIDGLLCFGTSDELSLPYPHPKNGRGRNEERRRRRIRESEISTRGGN